MSSHHKSFSKPSLKRPRSRSRSSSSSASSPRQHSLSRNQHSHGELKDNPRSQHLSPSSHSDRKPNSHSSQSQRPLSPPRISQSRIHHRSRSRSSDRNREPRLVSQERPDRPPTETRDAPPSRPFRRGPPPPFPPPPPARGPPEGDAGDWGKPQPSDGSSEPPSTQPKEKPTLELSGNLLKDTNTFNGVIIKYSEPEEAKMPKRHWRLYEFKSDAKSSENGGLLRTLHMHRQSAFLIGTDQRVCDMHLLHPSISKQHAVWQYRCVNYTRADGFEGRRVLPYIMDLESTNGTFLNNDRIEARRYYELQPRDVLKFGFSSREYVVLYEGFRDTEPEADDLGVEQPKPQPAAAEKKPDIAKSDDH